MKAKKTARALVSTGAVYACSVIFIFVFHQLGRIAVDAAGINLLSLVQWIFFPAAHACFLVFMARWFYTGRPELGDYGGRIAGLVFGLHIVILFVSNSQVNPEQVEAPWHAPIIAGIMAFGPNITHDPWTAAVILKRTSFFLMGPLILSLVAVGANMFGGPNHRIERPAAR